MSIYSDEVFLEFRYLKNRMIDLGNGVSYDIPYKMVPPEDPGRTTAVPHYDLNKVHRVTLQNEEPDLPDKEGLSERKYSELVDDAWLEARDARKANANLRKRLQAYVNSGTIEIVNDPFAVKSASKSEPTPKSKPKQNPKAK